ncbi:hypothetical protein GUJ93_ZPchr0001g30751 [Zizania palustris]|uniref:Uncharacterized protein n=1 Tax=Zizania palustris TaxID=103762 RepID=A0A8J5RUE5_ZIZPA|nr:hypothetical protein GUJ93_ZPchr0001g30751 [Zizania palustris]
MSSSSSLRTAPPRAITSSVCVATTRVTTSSLKPPTSSFLHTASTSSRCWVIVGQTLPRATTSMSGFVPFSPYCSDPHLHRSCLTLALVGSEEREREMKNDRWWLALLLQLGSELDMEVKQN